MPRSRRSADSAMTCQRSMRSGLLWRPGHYAAVVSRSSDGCSDTTPSRHGRPCRRQEGGNAHQAYLNCLAEAASTVTKITDCWKLDHWVNITSREHSIHQPNRLMKQFSSQRTMPNNSSKHAVAATFALCMSVGTAGEILQPQTAQAISPDQQAQAIRAIRSAGCGLEFQGLSSARITCSTQAIARLVQPQLNNSSLKLYNSRGKSYARFKIGSTSAQTKRISNIYYNPKGPLNLKIMPDDLNSRSMLLTGTREGFRLTTSFESSGTEFQVEDKWFGSWKDNAVPDLHWNNGQVTANLALNRNMTLSNISNIGVSGQWSIRSGFDVIPDNVMNSKVREGLNVIFQNYLPSINTLITQKLKTLARRIPDARAQRARFSFVNGNISATVPLTNRPNSETQRSATQRLTLSKAYRIKDDENFKDEFKNYNESSTINVERNASATAFKPSGRSNSPRHCAGGEVRIEDWDRVEVDRNGIAKIWVSMELYEGTSCNSNDRDGRKIGVHRDGRSVGSPFMVVRPGQTDSRKLRVNNTDEGGDYGQITYTFTNMNASR